MLKQGGKFFRGRLEGVNAARRLAVVDAALKTAEAIVLHQQLDGNSQRLACGLSTALFADLFTEKELQQ